MKIFRHLDSEPCLSVDRKHAIVNALAFYAEFHGNALEDVDFKFWRQCFDADSKDLEENLCLSVDDVSTQIANYYPKSNP